MRFKWMAMAVLTGIAVPALAARPMTVEQLRQTIASAQSTHQSDDAAAATLADIKLTSRLTGDTLRSLAASCPGPKTVEALHAVADESAFLDPPPDELPATPAPDFATQKAIIGRVINYVVHTMPTLPNLLATRETESYVDTLRGWEEKTSQARGDLLLLGDNRTPVTFKDGREVDDPSGVALASGKAGRNRDAKAAASTPVLGMSSWGEFGPILSVVLVDAAKSKLGWARWQLQGGQPVAVFQFSVDRSISQYQLNYCCESSMGTYTEEPVARPIVFKPGYHGRFEVDPATGTVLRVIIEADLRSEDPIRRASMMVEYGHVKIGDSERICPTRSVSISISRSEFKSHGNLESINRLLLNDVQFTGYHRFGSEATMVAGMPDEALPSPAPPAVANPSSETAPNPPAASTPAETASDAASAAPAPATPAALAPPVDEEVAIGSADSLPSFSGNGDTGPGSSTTAGGSGFTLRANTRSVDITLIAVDKHGKPITGLKQGDIAIFDNGRPQQVSHFFHPGSTDAAPPTPAAATSDTDPGTFTNAAAAPAQPQDSPDLLIVLLDESHLAYLDLNRARNEVIKFLAGTKPSSRVALYGISEKGFHVLQDVTADHDLVISRLKAWTPDVKAVSQGQAAPSQERNTMQVNSLSDPIDLGDVQGSAPGVPAAMLTGNIPLRYALQGMMALARHFASVPGHKSLAWISGDAALGSFLNTKSNPQLDTALQKTGEALNEAQIALYAVDASSPDMGGGGRNGFDATAANPNGDTPAITNGPLAPRLTPASAPLEMAAVGIQAPVRQLAEATGGRAVNKGSDLKGTLDNIARDSSSHYEVAFAPDTAADGKFHSLQVKVAGRKDVSLRYRAGYLYSEETPSTAERFQQAVWSPQDASAIGLTAEALSADETTSGKGTVKLRVSFPGLALEHKGDRWTDQLYIFVAVRDDATQKAQVSGETLRLSLRQASYDTGMPAGIPYRTVVEPKSKLGSVRIIVVDANSGRMGSVTLPSSALHP
jgi:VWFA-related protein